MSPVSFYGVTLPNNIRESIIERISDSCELHNTYTEACVVNIDANRTMKRGDQIEYKFQDTGKSYSSR